MDAQVVNGVNEVSLDNLSMLFCSLYSEKLLATFYSGVFYCQNCREKWELRRIHRGLPPEKSAAIHFKSRKRIFVILFYDSYTSSEYCKIKKIFWFY